MLNWRKLCNIKESSISLRICKVNQVVNQVAAIVSKSSKMNFWFALFLQKIEAKKIKLTWTIMIFFLQYLCFNALFSIKIMFIYYGHCNIFFYLALLPADQMPSLPLQYPGLLVCWKYILVPLNFQHYSVVLKHNLLFLPISINKISCIVAKLVQAWNEHKK